MSVRVAEDRSLSVRPDQIVLTRWVDIDDCRLGSRAPMSPEAVEKAFRRIVNLGDCEAWPPVVGHWEGQRFVVCDGRHHFIASLIAGRGSIFVAWLAPR